MRENKKFKSILIYTGIFAVISCIVFYPMYQSGKSLVWTSMAGDGLSQHLNSLAYWGEYLRAFFANLFAGHPSVPMWDMSLGYGGDILSTLNYYAIGDPLNLIYAFVSKKNTEYLYDFMIIFRMYLAGLSFMAYCFYMKKGHRAAVFGSLIYVFTGFTLWAGIRHPFFLNPLIYLPLLLMGAEKIFKKEKPFVFIISVCISAMSNYYFLYMLTVFTVLYALIRFFSYVRENYLTNFFRIVGRFLGYYLLGLGLSAVILLPSVIGFLGNGRSSENISVGMFYPMRYYSRVLLNFVGFGNSGNSVSLSFVPMAGLAVLLLFAAKNKDKKYTPLKVAFGLAVIFLSVKVFGYGLNGFAYVTNRWTFVIGFVVAYIFVEMYPRLFSMTSREKWLVGIGIALLAVYSVIAQKFVGGGFYTHGSNSAVIALAGSFLCICLIQKIGSSYQSVVSSIMVALLIIGSLGIHSYYRFGPRKGKYTEAFMDSGKGYDSLVDDSAKLLKSTGDTGVFRVNTNQSLNHNYGQAAHLNTVNNYYSVTNGNVGKTVESFQTLNLTYLFKFKGLDHRIGLYGLNGVKYISVENNKNASEAWKKKGFEPITIKNGKLLLKNRYALPFGYSYDSYITSEEYKKMNGIEREQAMLQSVVLNEKEPQIQRGNPAFSITKKNIKLERKSIKVKKRYQMMQLDLDIVPGEDNYLYIKGLEYENDRKGKNTYFITLLGQGWRQELRIQQKGSSYSFGRKDYILHLGKLKDKSLSIIFNKRGKYKVDDLKILAVNQKETLHRLKRLKERGVMKQASYKDNNFSGKIFVGENRMLCIPIPYSAGWKAQDNGKDMKIKKVNGMYMGWLLTPGEHEIRMTYRTPGLVPGAAISIFTLGLLLVLWKRRRF
ncbi:YfhO family protein [Anaerostipes sp.]|uniref:YfhO family protein n=1 Tax=Anaerostipes sp. TaxID=1872530 RepID=UPI0025BFE27C|nr:YfhO family protein [Anaerostipes sp.]MBS7007105.1 YfhO family protein [Anaerostipes sp.]